jgi:phosphoribosylanthranilate isomerase
LCNFVVATYTYVCIEIDLYCYSHHTNKVAIYTYICIEITFAKTHYTVLTVGINSKNIIKAYKTVLPQVIDLSSSVEENGFKSYNKIKELILTIRKE